MAAPRTGQAVTPTHLTSGRSSLDAAPERGGLLTGLTLDGHELLFMDWDTFRDPVKSVRGGIPVLFPSCGPLRADQVAIGDGTYPMKQHGFARNLPWTVAEQTDDALALALDSSDATRASWPFDFRLRCRYRLDGGTLRIDQEVHNGSAAPMPMALGLHPYFRVGDKARLRLDVPASHASPNPEGAAAPYAGALDFDREVIDLCFVDMREPRAAFEDEALGRRIEVRADPLYRYFVIWTLRGRDFLCLEPWTARGYALNSGADVTRVAAGKTLRTWVEISVTTL